MSRREGDQDRVIVVQKVDSDLTFRPVVHELPPKQGNKHRWIVTCGYTITEENALAAMTGADKILLDMENLVAFVLGCWDCEESWQTVYGQPCHAEEWKNSS